MKRILSSIICLLTVFVSSGFAQTSVETGDIAKIKSKVTKFAASKKRVVVVTRSDEKTKGYVTGFDDDKFTVSDPKSGQTETFQYSSVKKINKNGGFSTGHIIAIAAAGGGFAIIYATLGRRCRNEGGCF
jgi:hypothetical protein